MAQRSKGDAKQIGCLGLDSTRPLESLQQKLPLNRLDGLVQVKALGGERGGYGECSPVIPALPHIVGQAGRRERISGLQGQGPLDHIFKLPDVPWPEMLLQ